MARILLYLRAESLFIEMTTMRYLLLTVIGLLCTLLWLSLLEATSFSNLAISAGLLGVLLLTNRTW